MARGRAARAWSRVGLSLAVVLAVAGGAGLTDASSFDASAASLQAKIGAYEAAGMPSDQAAPIEAQLAALRARTVLGLPYAAVSGAALREPAPLITLRRQAASAYGTWAAAEAERRAEADLTTQAAQPGGMPADIAGLAGQMSGVLASAQKWNVDPQPAAQVADIEAGYELLPASLQASIHDEVLGLMQESIGQVQARVAAKQTAKGMMRQLRSLLGTAEWLGTAQPADQGTVDGLGAATQDARSDAQISAVTIQLEALVPKLQKEANSQPPEPALPTACIVGAPAKLIEIHLSTQVLDAYDNGCPTMAFYVTTGRPALPTDRGTFHIFYKARLYLMHSPWPYWSPFWYPDTWVGYAMEFIGDGTFIHTADWEPPAAYGKGSEYGAYASHGCVHVMDGPAAQLFAWAPIGTEVIVGD